MRLLIWTAVVAWIGLAEAELLRSVANKPNDDNEGLRRRNLKVSKKDNDALTVTDIDSGNGVASIMEKKSGCHLINYSLGGDKASNNKILIKSCPATQELSIRTIGNDKKNTITNADRELLHDLATLLEQDIELDTDSVDTTPSQSARTAKLLADWPQDLDVEFVFDKEKEIARHEKREKEARERVVSLNGAPLVPGGNSRRRQAAVQLPSMVEKDPNTGERRLAYTTICNLMYTWVTATHDDWNYNRWDDRTTYNAYVAPYPSCGAADGTYFWKNSQWQCYEPDHDPNVEYAYGECFGRCGAGCGDNGKGTYTYDCLDHDSCVRFGHGIASLWCNDEFTSTVDDYTFAPNCI